MRGGGKKMSEEEVRSSKLPPTSIHGQKTLDKIIGREGTSTKANVSSESGDPRHRVGANMD